MPRIKQSKNLINTQMGGESTCYHCQGKPTIVLHDNYKFIELKHYELEPSIKRIILESFNKQCDQKFLCKKCYEANYQLNPNLVDETGQYQYTTIPIKEWGKVEYVFVEDKVKELS